MNEMKTNEGALLNERETAEFLGVSRRTLQGWRSNQTGPRWVRINTKSIRYRQSDLTDWIERRTVTPTNQN